ncbi:MAG: hypothetical protein WAO95_17660 [Burkholderiales bacterium]
MKVEVGADFHKDNVVVFFKENWREIALFHTGVQAIMFNRPRYFDSPIRLPILRPITTEEHGVRFKALLNLVRAGDLLLTFNSDNWISRLISYFDNGPWSHCAFCSGQGTVLEAIPAGVSERPLEAYKGKRFRLGLYRHPHAPSDISEVLSFARSRIGDGYSYRKAILSGLRKHFRIRRRLPTPNDLAISPELHLVAIV